MALELLAAFLTFVAVSAAVLGLTRRSRGSAAEQRMAMLAARHRPAPEADYSSRALFRNSVSSFGLFRQYLTSKNWAESTALTLERAGVRLKVSEYLMIRLILAVVLGAFFFIVIGPTLTGIVIAGLAGLAGFFLPRFYVSGRTRKRQQMLSGQLAEALQLIANGLRSGVAFQQAMKIAAAQLPSPMAEELHKCIQDTNLGLPQEEALQNMAERVGSQDMDLVVTTILIQRTAGGRLSEVLERIAETMRERERLHGEIHAMTGQQRLTGNIMAVYPVVLGLLFFALSPDLMSVLWEESLGRVLLGVAVFLQVLAIVTMRRIVKLEV
jgi:tight adherence protein B